MVKLHGVVRHHVIDEVPVAGGHRLAHHRPLVLDLAEHLARLLVVAAEHEIDERAAIELRLVARAEQVQQRRENVDVADRLVDPARRDAGDVDDERHPGLLRIDVVAVLADPVLAEPLAVVGGENGDRAIPRAEPLQLVEDAPDVDIGEGDFAVVEIGLAIAEIARGAVGVAFVEVVRIVEM